MNNKLSPKERKYLELIKSLPCSICSQAAPSEAHHVKQHKQYIAIPLCYDCHRGSFLGWHGQKKSWQIHKMDELDALNETIRKLFELGSLG